MGYRPRRFDQIVVGAGVYGSSIAYHLSQRAGRTALLEQFGESHANGSSHGRTRILRTAYTEGAAYVPIVLRSRTIWIQLGRRLGEPLFRPIGTVIIGPSGSPEFDSARRIARRFGLPTVPLDAERAARRFPAFRFADDSEVLWDPLGGVLSAEGAVRGFVTLARRRGVSVRCRTKVLEYKPRSDGLVEVRTNRGDMVAERVVFAAGAWTSRLVPALRPHLTIEQQTVYWFPRRKELNRPLPAFPAFVWYMASGGYYYGTPDGEDCVKVGSDIGQRVDDPERRPPRSAREARAVRAFVRRQLVGVDGKAVQHSRCLYTNSPDGHFIIDRVDGDDRLIFVSACSGHGFKFASGLGELIAKFAINGAPPPLLRPFSLARLLRIRRAGAPADPPRESRPLELSRVATAERRAPEPS